MLGFPEMACDFKFQQHQVFLFFPLRRFQSIHTTFCNTYCVMIGAWGNVVVKALLYQSDGPGMYSLWCHWIFQWHIPSDRTMALGSTQPLVKMSGRNFSWG
jgi:hypothetical protein